MWQMWWCYQSTLFIWIENNEKCFQSHIHVCGVISRIQHFIMSKCGFAICWMVNIKRKYSKFREWVFICWREVLHSQQMQIKKFTWKDFNDWNNFCGFSAQEIQLEMQKCGNLRGRGIEIYQRKISNWISNLLRLESSL